MFFYHYSHSVTCHIFHVFRRFWPNNRSRMYILENTGELPSLIPNTSCCIHVIRAKKVGSSEPSVAPVDEGIFDSILSDIVVGSVRYSDLFLPLAEGMNITNGYGLSYAFEEDFPMTFPDGSTGS
ncbi:hypothetical protein BHE74_00042449 [Ensete ventricosum]|nr:hypothetical protein BHE74_00042449 [Ensete ventricosum]